MPIADGAHACPFVAFDDERDERSSVPDHRHRCYADTPPAPRALAHQEAYCLSTAFPVCPVFQDWARRESARARGAPEAVPAEDRPSAADVGFAAAVTAADGGTGPAAIDDRSGYDDVDEEADRSPLHDDGGTVQRNPPRDWSAPPPWLASAEATDAAGGQQPGAPTFLASRQQPGQGLAGSAADQLAGGPPPVSRQSPSYRGAAAAGAIGAAGAASGGTPPDPGPETLDETSDLAQPAPPRRPRAYDQHLGGPSSGPDWERPKRYEAYPTIRTRVGLPPIPRIAAMVVALAIAAIALFFLPALLGLGNPDSGSALPSVSASPSASVEPTPTPVPTPIVYLIQKGDTLSKIASANGMTLEELLAANPTIKDPNKITEGQQIIIPVPEPSAEAPAAGSSAPGSAAP